MRGNEAPAAGSVKAPMTPQPASNTRILAVDLDGTLLRGDLVWESLVRYVFPRIWRTAQVLGWFARGGRPLLKARLAEHISLKPAGLVWNEACIQFCRQRAEGGQMVMIASASNDEAVQRATQHLGFVNRRIGSDAITNLKSRRKAEWLAAEFGVGNFEYVGDSQADLAVWSAAAEAHFVGREAKRRRLEKVLGKPLHPVAAEPGRSAFELLRALRPHQWLKNLLVFFPLIAAHRWSDLSCWQKTIPVFVALCGMAAGAYVINDLADLDDDRAHPRKRHRPFAGGSLAIPTGLITVAALVGLSVVAASADGLSALEATLCYLALSLTYTLILKTIPVLDTVVLASLYTFRMVLGGIAGGVMISTWLLAFSTAFFLGLAFLKRYVELRTAPRKALVPAARRRYRKGDIHFVFGAGLASSFLSVAVLGLYLDSATSRALYRAPYWLWLIALILLFWNMRIWLLAGRDAVHDDPVWFAARDWTTWGLIVLCFLAVAAAKPI